MRLASFYLHHQPLHQRFNKLPFLSHVVDGVRGWVHPLWKGSWCGEVIELIQKVAQYISSLSGLRYCFFLAGGSERKCNHRILRNTGFAFSYLSCGIQPGTCEPTFSLNQIYVWERWC